MNHKHTPGPYRERSRNDEIATIESVHGPIICYVNLLTEKGEANARLLVAATELFERLEQALRYIEVSVAYRGAMTADQVEAAIKERTTFPSRVEIAANSCKTLASFDIEKARAVIAKVSGEL